MPLPESHQMFSFHSLPVPIPRVHCDERFHHHLHQQSNHHQQLRYHFRQQTALLQWILSVLVLNFLQLYHSCLEQSADPRLSVLHIFSHLHILFPMH